MGSKRKRAPREGGSSKQLAQKRLRQEADATSSASDLLNDKKPFPENPTREDLKREARLYEILGSEDAADRLAAADVIVLGLLDDDGVQELILQRHLDRRLFRGLASGRKASRLGFSLVLTEILSQLYGKKALAGSRYASLTFDKVFNLLLENTRPSGNMPGQEEKDHYLGQLFGIECFVRAQVLFIDDTRWNTVLGVLLRLAKHKTWLRSQCGWVITQAVLQMTEEAAAATLQKLADEGLTKTPEAVGIWVAALDRFPEVKRPAKTWWDPLASKHLGDLAAALKDGGREETANGDDAGPALRIQANWTSQLHFVWDILLRHFAKLAEADDHGASAKFKLFWNRVVDDTFFAKNATEHQKFSGFMIFVKMLEGLSPHQHCMEKLFSKNFMACLMNQAAKEDRYLHRAAVKGLRAIDAAASDSSAIVTTILQQLLGSHGAFNFDQRTNTRTVDKILQHVSLLSPRPVFKILEDVFEAKSGGEDDEVKRRRIYGDYLFTLANVKADDDTTSSPSEVNTLAVMQLAKLAFPSARHPPGDPQHAVTQALRTRLMTAFAKLAKRPEDHSALIDAILGINETGVEMSTEIQDECRGALARIRTVMALERTKTAAARDATLHGLALLYAVALLQLYNEEPDAVGVLRDIGVCYDKLQEVGPKTSEGFSESLVEIMLAMLAQPSSLMRQVTLQVFESFTHLLTAEALELLTNVLGAEENVKGQQVLFSIEDDEMDEGDDDASDASGDDNGIDGEIASDVEFLGLQEGSNVEMNGNTDDKDEEDDDPEEVQALEDLDDALAKVLRSHRLDKDNEAASSSSDSAMSDSEMLALDDTLAQVFKKRTKHHSRKKEKKDAKETVVNFKSRVLDLLSVFVRKEAGTNQLAFGLLIPLLQLMRTTSAKLLAHKATETITEFGKSLRKSRGRMQSGTVRDDSTGLLDLLKEIHLEAAKDPSHAFARAGSAASLAVASHLFAVDTENMKEIAAVYASTQTDWALGRTRLQPAFFMEWVNWCQSHAASSRAA